MIELLLAATPRLLEGWCGPVVRRVEEDGELVGDVVWPRMYLIREGWETRAEMHDGDCAEVRDGVMGVVVGDEWWTLHLDLRRAECRDRVARVVADIAVGPSGYTSGSAWGVQWGRHGQHGGGSWMLNGVGDLRFADEPESADAIHVQALANLDPLDDTRLPDGSRAVDAHALAIVARHVLEGT